ncbi:MAG: hypothetical protein ACTXOO_04460 [Sodalis sp. (in: enterobacteria)]
MNTQLENVKNAIKKTYHAIHSQYTLRYPAKFEYQFNESYDLKVMIPSFLIAALKASTIPCSLLRLAELDR